MRYFPLSLLVLVLFLALVLPGSSTQAQPVVHGYGWTVTSFSSQHGNCTLGGLRITSTVNGFDNTSQTVTKCNVVAGNTVAVVSGSAFSSGSITADHLYGTFRVSYSLPRAKFGVRDLNLTGGDTRWFSYVYSDFRLLYTADGGSTFYWESADITNIDSMPSACSLIANVVTCDNLLVGTASESTITYEFSAPLTPTPTLTPTPSPTPENEIDIGVTCPVPGVGTVPANLIDNFSFEIDPVVSSSGWYPEILNSHWWGDLQPFSGVFGLEAFSYAGNGDDTITMIRQYLGVLSYGQRFLMGFHVAVDGCPYPGDGLCSQGLSNTIGLAYVAVGNTYSTRDEYFLSYDDLASNFSQEDGACEVVGDGLGGYRYDCDYKRFEVADVYGDGGTNHFWVNSQPLLYASVYMDDVFLLPVTDGPFPEVDCSGVEEWYDDNSATPTPTVTPIPTLEPIETLVLPTYGPLSTIDPGVGLTPRPTSCYGVSDDDVPALVLDGYYAVTSQELPTFGLCFAPNDIAFAPDHPIRAVVQPEVMLAVLAPAIGMMLLAWVRKR